LPSAEAGASSHLMYHRCEFLKSFNQTGSVKYFNII
jgi:hypothetical protein